MVGSKSTYQYLFRKKCLTQKIMDATIETERRFTTMAMMMVRSFLPCPICGREMRQTGGGWYYEHDAGLVELECRTCNLTIHEFGFEHGFKDGEAHSYGKLMNILKERIKK